MDITLTDAECRIFGSLIEKEITTPEYYPLSLNALMMACNQKSNRWPVMDLSEEVVRAAVDSLRTKQMAWERREAGARVLKYEQNLSGHWAMTAPETAVLAELLLRGPQTAGELKNRASRMHPFASPEEVQETLRKLMAREDGPGAFAAELPKQRGTKEVRYAHLFAGMPVVQEGAEAAGQPQSAATPVSGMVLIDAARVEKLEAEVTALKEELGKAVKRLDALEGIAGEI